MTKRNLFIFVKLTPETNKEVEHREGKTIVFKNFYFQGSFEEKKFTSFLKTDDENNYIIIIKILLPLVYIQGSFDKKKFIYFCKTDAGNKQGSRAPRGENYSF